MLAPNSCNKGEFVFGPRLGNGALDDMGVAASVAEIALVLGIDSGRVMGTKPLRLIFINPGGVAGLSAFAASRAGKAKLLVAAGPSCRTWPNPMRPESNVIQWGCGSICPRFAAVNGINTGPLGGNSACAETLSPSAATPIIRSINPSCIQGR